MHNNNGSRRLVGEVQMFRIRVAAAESKLKLLRDQAWQAKRRRKEAKRAAQRARKQFKRFKADVAELQQALAKAEAKLFQAGGRALARKLAKARPVVKRAAPASKKSRAALRKARPASLRISRATRRPTRRKIVIQRAEAIPEIPVQVAAPDGTPSAPEIPCANP